VRGAPLAPADLAVDVAEAQIRIYRRERLEVEYIAEERLMESTLYQSAVRRGEAKSSAETIIRILSHRMGALDPALRDQLRGVSDLDTLTPWYEEALLAVDAEAAQRLAEKIRKALSP
jgi:hypothetical protein